MEVGIVDRTGADHQVLEVVEDPIVVVEERDVAVVAAVRRRLGRDHDVGLAQVQPPEGRELRHVRDVRGRARSSASNETEGGVGLDVGPHGEHLHDVILGPEPAGPALHTRASKPPTTPESGLTMAIFSGLARATGETRPLTGRRSRVSALGLQLGQALPRRVEAERSDPQRRP